LIGFRAPRRKHEENASAQIFASQSVRRIRLGPTVDGLILPRHPFDPGAPQISEDVPLLTAQIFTEGEVGSTVPMQCDGSEEINTIA